MGLTLVVISFNKNSAHSNRKVACAIKIAGDTGKYAAVIRGKKIKDQHKKPLAGCLSVISSWPEMKSKEGWQYSGFLPFATLAAFA
jgi:hypothetical protein